MAKKIQRIYRTGPRSAEEVARDKEIRRHVQTEFPPVARSNHASGQLSRALKDALRASNKTPFQIAQDAGVSQVLLSRFLSGELDIHMETADKLAEAIGLKLASAS